MKLVGSIILLKVLAARRCLVSIPKNIKCFEFLYVIRKNFMSFSYCFWHLLSVLQKLFFSQEDGYFVNLITLEDRVVNRT